MTATSGRRWRRRSAIRTGESADGDGAEEAIAQLFDDYQSGFNDYDMERICNCFALPAIIWQHEKGHVFNDDEELIENIEVLC
jgi:hypothetical protein